MSWSRVCVSNRRVCSWPHTRLNDWVHAHGRRSDLRVEHCGLVLTEQHDLPHGIGAVLLCLHDACAATGRAAVRSSSQRAVANVGTSLLPLPSQTACTRSSAPVTIVCLHCVTHTNPKVEPLTKNRPYVIAEHGWGEGGHGCTRYCTIFRPVNKRPTSQQ